MVVQALRKQPNNSVCCVTQKMQQLNVSHKAQKPLQLLQNNSLASLCAPILKVHAWSYAWQEQES